MNRFCATHKHLHEILTICKRVSQIEIKLCTLIQSYSLQIQLISTGCNVYGYNIVVKLIPFEICLIHTSTTHLDS